MDRFEAFSLSVLELNRCLQKIKDMEAKRYGLRAGHVMCLYHLGRSPQGLTASQLKESCREDKAAISRCVRELMLKGLVVTETERTYRARIQLTEDGKEMARRIDERVAAVLDAIGSDLTEQQREQLYSTLEIILQNMEDYLARQDAE